MPEKTNYEGHQSNEIFNPGGGDGMKFPMGWSNKSGRLKLNKIFVPGGLTYHTIIVKYNSNFSSGPGNWITGIEHHYKVISPTDEFIGSYDTTEDINGDLSFAYIPIKYTMNDDSSIITTDIGNVSYNINGSNNDWDNINDNTGVNYALYYDNINAAGGVYPSSISVGTFGLKSAKSVDVIPV